MLSCLPLPAHLALGEDGSVFVVGLTESSDFPVTTGALQTAPGSGGGFVAKLNPAGSLVYATTLGDVATGIALASAGDVFISGGLPFSASGFPSTGGTVTGTAMFLKEKNPAIQVWAMDPFGSLLTKYFRTGEVGVFQREPDNWYNMIPQEIEPPQHRKYRNIVDPILSPRADTLEVELGAASSFEAWPWPTSS